MLPHDDPVLAVVKALARKTITGISVKSSVFESKRATYSPVCRSVWSMVDNVQASQRIINEFFMSINPCQLKLTSREGVTVFLRVMLKAIITVAHTLPAQRAKILLPLINAADSDDVPPKRV